MDKRAANSGPREAVIAATEATCCAKSCRLKSLTSINRAVGKSDAASAPISLAMSSLFIYIANVWRSVLFSARGSAPATEFS